MRLPAEVIVEIINNLDSLDASSTLASCALISWAFKHDSERMLYKTVEIWLGDHIDFWKYVACLRTLATTSKGTLVLDLSLNISLPSNAPEELWPIDDICNALLAAVNLEELTMYAHGLPPRGTDTRLVRCFNECTFQLKQFNARYWCLDFHDLAWVNKQHRLKTIQVLDGYISPSILHEFEGVVLPRTQDDNSGQTVGDDPLCLFRRCLHPHSMAGPLACHGAIYAFPYLSADVNSWSAEPIRDAVGAIAVFIPVFKIVLAQLGDGQVLQRILKSVAECFPRVVYLKLRATVLSLHSDPHGIAASLHHFKEIRRLAVEAVSYGEEGDTSAYECEDRRKCLATAWSEYCPTLCVIRFPNFRAVQRKSQNSAWTEVAPF